MRFEPGRAAPPRELGFTGIEHEPEDDPPSAATWCIKLATAKAQNAALAHPRRAGLSYPSTVSRRPRRAARREKRPRRRAGGFFSSRSASSPFPLRSVISFWSHEVDGRAGLRRSGRRAQRVPHARSMHRFVLTRRGHLCNRLNDYRRDFLGLAFQRICVSAQQ